MSVTLTPQLEDRIRQKIQAGTYSTAEELIEEALQALEERERLNRLKAAIALGDAQLARGEGVLYTSELMDEIEREAEEAFLRGEQPRSDVCP